MRLPSGVGSKLISRQFRITPSLQVITAGEAWTHPKTNLYQQGSAARKGVYSGVTRYFFSSQAERIPSCTSALLARMHHPDVASRVAIVNVDSSHSTYDDLCVRSKRLSMLLKPYVTSGSTLASYCSGSEEYVVAMMAAWRLQW
jgi:hypothetical protein